MGKYVVLADCAEEEVQSLADALRYDEHGFEVESYIANWKRTGKWSELKRYATYFGVAFRLFWNRRHYAVIVGWQQFYALIFSFFCRMFHVRKCTEVVVLNFTYKPKLGRAAALYRWFMGRCLSEEYLDYLHVLSETYADRISSEFGFPRERIIVTGFGVNDEYERLTKLSAPEPFGKEGYALAIGRSNRNYDFLISAWDKIAYPLVIISDTYQGSAESEHILILRNVAGRDSEPWIANCGLMILPIDDGSICSGDTVLLTAMSLKRKIIVTEPSTLAEMYVLNGENALVAPKEQAAFRKVAEDALFSNRYDYLGENAREQFLKMYSRTAMGKSLTDKLKI